MLDFLSRCYLDSVQISLGASHRLLEANFALVDVDFLAVLVPWLRTVPESPDYVLCMTEEDLRENFVKVMLF